MRIRIRRASDVMTSELLEPRTLLATYYVSPAGADAAAGTSRSAVADASVRGRPRRRGRHGRSSAPGSYVGFDLRTSGTAAARITFKADRGAVINQVNTGHEPRRDQPRERILRHDRRLHAARHRRTRHQPRGHPRRRRRLRHGAVQQGRGRAEQRVRPLGLLGHPHRLRRRHRHPEQRHVALRARARHLLQQQRGPPGHPQQRLVGQHGLRHPHERRHRDGQHGLPNVDGIISGALVDGNTCYGNGLAERVRPGGGSGINCDGVRDSRFTNNLLYDNHAGGISLYQIDAAGPASGNVIANNTVIQAADGRWCLLVTDGAVNTTVFNNIFFNLHSFRGSISLSPDSASGFVSDYNFLDPRFSTDDANSAVALTQWRTATGQDRALDGADERADAGAVRQLRGEGFHAWQRKRGDRQGRERIDQRHDARPRRRSTCGSAARPSGGGVGRRARTSGTPSPFAERRQRNADGRRHGRQRHDLAVAVGQLQSSSRATARR